MIMTVGICDDDTKQIQALKNHLHLFEMEHNIDFEISLYTSGEQLLQDYHAKKGFHVLFLDVEMPGINGIVTASAIRRDGDDKVRIVFVSNYPKYMQDSFNVQAFQYLQKPLAYHSFAEIMRHIIQSYEKSHTTKLLVSEDGSERLVNINDIISVESLKNRKNMLRFVLTENEIITRGSLLEWKEALEGCHFVTPYRGILVNMNHIHYIKKDSLIMSSGAQIPLSRRADREIRNLFSKHIVTIRND